MSSSIQNLYEILNVRSNATFDELKSNYKQLILQCHPDKLQQDKPTTSTNVDLTSTVAADPNADKSNREFVAINKAWNTLKDPAKRKLYDAELLLNKFQTHSNIYERLKLADMNRTITITDEEVVNDDDNDIEKTPATFVVYTYDCRCGGQYIIDESEVNNELLNHTSSSSSSNCKSNDNDVGGDGDGDVIVECNECSLVIILNGGGN